MAGKRTAGASAGAGKRGRRQQRERARRGVAAAAKLAAGAAAVGAAVAVPADAATFTVTNLNDSGAGSLRDAISQANALAGADVIDFQAGLTGTITLTTGQLAIRDAVDIQGPGAGALSVSGNNASRVFYLYDPAATPIDVAISGLTITGGEATQGAGILDQDENLTLDHVTISGNHTSGDGGGLWLAGRYLGATIRDSTISGNVADDDGGGIYDESLGSPLLVQRTTIANNQASDRGGGVYFYDADQAITIEDSTISGNTAGVGGGVYLYDGGPFTLRRTTVSGNSAATGGGIFFEYPDEGVLIENSTISGNTAGEGAGGGIYVYELYGFDIRHSTIVGNTGGRSGGGIFTYGSPLNVENSIIAGNTASADNDLGTYGDGSVDLAYTLVEDPGTANIGDNGGNLFNQSPQLGPLANNGGPTQTHLPAATSPVVNAGDPAIASPPSTDQRGLARIVGGRIDMGAVELNPGTVQLAVAAASVGEGAGAITITVTRTGGADGAISVGWATADGTAQSPGDYTGASGTVNFANQDATAKTFQVTIVQDSLVEPAETFTVSLGGPTGGAALGSPATETVTILDDDTPVPTLDEWGRILLAAILGGASLVTLRRRRGLRGPALGVLLAAGAIGAAPAEARDHAKQLVTVDHAGGHATAHLPDGSTLDLATVKVEVKDRRPPRERRAHPLPAGIAVLDAGVPARVFLHQGHRAATSRLVIVVGGPAT